MSVNATEVRAVKMIKENAPSWLIQAKEKARTKFNEIGFPNRKTEDWKYANLSWLAAFSDKDSILVSETAVTNNDNEIQLSHGKLVSKPKNVHHLEVLPLVDAINAYPQKIEKLIEHYWQLNHDGFSLSALASLEKGLFITVPKGKHVDETVFLKILSEKESAEKISLFIYLEEGASLSLSELYQSTDDELSYFNQMLRLIYLDKNAKLNVTRLQAEGKSANHISHSGIFLEEKSDYHEVNLDFGAKFARHNPEAHFLAENASATLNGLYCVSDKQYVDTHSAFNHHVGHCKSRQLYKGILNGKAQAVFNGRVIVAKDAIKTCSAQQNKNLLLSEKAEVDTKPELQIYADDVKCAHGATVGQLDDNALFYLRSRGINHQQAVSLLVFAFANDIVIPISNELMKTQIKAMICHYLGCQCDD